ncbi:hypothetical protein [Microbacterium sp.]|uniref:hypothetical protein n=1 Tax=Microbacterium sp. TaxID=51671 RepID=UPI003736CA8B
MASGPHDDDEALRWEGDEAAPPTALPSGWHAVGKGSDAVTDAAPATNRAPAAPDREPETGGAQAARSAEDFPTDAPALGNVALVSLGLLGGIYLLYTVGWVIGGLRMLDAGAFLVPPAAVVPAVWLGIAAPALWLGGTLLLTRRSAGWVRLVWLIAGVFLLVPWPFVMGV